MWFDDNIVIIILYIILYNFAVKLLFSEDVTQKLFKLKKGQTNVVHMKTSHKSSLVIGVNLFSGVQSKEVTKALLPNTKL